MNTETKELNLAVEEFDRVTDGRFQHLQSVSEVYQECRRLVAMDGPVKGHAVLSRCLGVFAKHVDRTEFINAMIQPGDFRE